MLRMVANLREDEFSLCWLELIFFSFSLSLFLLRVTIRSFEGLSFVEMESC